MKILVNKLPSRGFGSTLDIIDLLPLNYGELLKYSAERSSDPLSDLIWDIDTFIKTIPNWERLSSFDTYTIIAYRKMLTLDLKGKIKFKSGLEIDLMGVDFSDIDSRMVTIESVELGGVKRKPQIRSMGEFYNKLVEFSQNGVTDDKLAILGCYLNMNPNELLSLTGEDIVICERLYDKIISHPTVNLEGGGEVILVGKASQLFQCLLESCRPSDAKIQFSEKV